MAMVTDCDHNLLVWIDLEMSGLDLNIHTIVEIAIAITDFQLKNYIEGWNLFRTRTKKKDFNVLYQVRILLFIMIEMYSIE
jgi:oligoribonuclease (3'-5' exoribonuclease)